MSDAREGEEMAWRRENVLKPESNDTRNARRRAEMVLRAL